MSTGSSMRWRHGLRLELRARVLFVGCGLFAPTAGDLEAVSPQSASDTIPLVFDFVHDGQIGEWRAWPVERVLAPGRTGVQGLVWIGQVEAGLAVALELRAAEGGDPAATRVSVGLAGAGPTALPPVGWGHQFGFEKLETVEECERWEGWEPSECAAWFERQVRHRETVTRLLERRWEVTGGTAGPPRETVASAALESTSRGVRERLSPLSPAADASAPELRRAAIEGTPGAVGLEFLIPWEAFPPVPAPVLSDFRFSVGWTGAAGESGGGGQVGMEPAVFPRPLSHRVTACGYGTRGIVLLGDPRISARFPSEDAAVYMRPRAEPLLDRLIVIDNEAAGYQYTPEPGAISPAAFEATYTTLQAPGGGTLCGPVLALAADGSASRAARWTRTRQGAPEALVDMRQVQVREGADGGLFVMEGPRVFWTYYGSGQCGACPRVELEVYHVDRSTGAVTSAFRYASIADASLGETEIMVSDDWARIDVFESRAEEEGNPGDLTWGVRRYCLDAGEIEYRLCGAERPVPEPPERLRLEYEEAAGLR